MIAPVNFARGMYGIYAPRKVKPPNVILERRHNDNGVFCVREGIGAAVR